MRYVDTSAVLRILFSEPGLSVPLDASDRAVSSELLEIEAFRTLERARLTGKLDDSQAAIKRKELVDLIAMLDLAPIDRAVIDRAKASFGVNVRALDAIHVATAEVLATEAEGEGLEFWTHDDSQRVAALARGLSVHGV